MASPTSGGGWISTASPQGRDKQAVSLAARMPSLSIIIPVLNEAEVIAIALAHLAPLRARGMEIIVVDGGSEDGTVARAAELADMVISAPEGAARR